MTASIIGQKEIDGGTSEAALAAQAKALGHPARIRIVQLLLERPNCMGSEIVDVIGLAQSTVSEHLRILKAADIICGEVERPRICYALNQQGIAGLLHWLTQLHRQACLQSASSECVASISSQSGVGND